MELVITPENWSLLWVLFEGFLHPSGHVHSVLLPELPKGRHLSLVLTPIMPDSLPNKFTLCPSHLEVFYEVTPRLDLLCADDEGFPDSAILDHWMGKLLGFLV